MKFIAKLKNKFAFHIISICGWVYFYYFLFALFYCHNTNSIPGIFLAIITIILERLIVITLMIWAIETITNHNIKNIKKKKNPFYHIFWILGVLFSLIINVWLISALVYYLIEIKTFLFFR